MARAHRALLYASLAIGLYLLVFFQFIALPWLHVKTVEQLLAVVRVSRCPRCKQSHLCRPWNCNALSLYSSTLQPYPMTGLTCATRLLGGCLSRSDLILSGLWDGGYTHSEIVRKPMLIY